MIHDVIIILRDYAKLKGIAVKSPSDLSALEEYLLQRLVLQQRTMKLILTNDEK